MSVPAATAAASGVTKAAERLTMFIVVRKDLVEVEGWPIGAIMTQACHAATAALWTFKDLPNTQAYVDDIANMTKVTLEAKGLPEMNAAAVALEALGISVYRWREQPEDLVTCFATAPALRSETGKALKKVRLWR